MSKNKTETIFQEERLEQILQILEEQDRLHTQELANTLNTTPATIRKDLSKLEEEGLLKRTHGGAVKAKKLFTGLSLREKEQIKIDEKRRLVKEAAKLVMKDDTVILDSGSTTSLLAKEIKNIKGLTVITNAINVITELVDSNVEIIVIGGTLIKETLTLMGPLADATLRRISSAKLFMGVDGLDFDAGLTTPNIQEAQTTKTMMDVSGETILMCDESKFGRRSLGVICPIGNIDKLITTKEMTQEEILLCERSGVEVRLV